MSEASEEKMLLRWNYWQPSPIGGSVRGGKCVVDSLRHAVKVSGILKETHGNDLVSVDVVIRLVST